MTPSWETLLSEPAGSGPVTDPAEWFDRIARRLLGGSRLMVGGVPHRLTEIEFYYHAEGHRDPFAHCQPVQLFLGRWYFHRSGGTYRGGSFKGVDLTFAGPEAYGGILIRGMEAPGPTPQG